MNVWLSYEQIVCMHLSYAVYIFIALVIVQYVHLIPMIYLSDQKLCSLIVMNVPKPNNFTPSIDWIVNLPRTWRTIKVSDLQNTNLYRVNPVRTAIDSVMDDNSVDFILLNELHFPRVRGFRAGVSTRTVPVISVGATINSSTWGSGPAQTALPSFRSW